MTPFLATRIDVLSRQGSSSHLLFLQAGHRKVVVFDMGAGCLRIAWVITPKKTLKKTYKFYLRSFWSFPRQKSWTCSLLLQRNVGLQEIAPQCRIHSFWRNTWFCGMFPKLWFLQSTQFPQNALPKNGVPKMESYTIMRKQKDTTFLGNRMCYLCLGCCQGCFLYKYMACHVINKSHWKL